MTRPRHLHDAVPWACRVERATLARMRKLATLRDRSPSDIARAALRAGLHVFESDPSRLPDAARRDAVSGDDATDKPVQDA